MNLDTERALKKSYLENLKANSEKELKDTATDYVTQYYALHHIRSLVEKMPELVDLHLISSLQAVLLDTRFLHQRQSLFFYRIAAEALCSVVVNCRARSLVLRGSVDAPDPWMEAHLGGGGPHPGENIGVEASPIAVPGQIKCQETT